ncbi:MAG: hypothetical protein QE493_00130 [Verrucomicrobiae bacterium]|jgi:hypothetical protein|nr:hypothetical protein [Verrucomicrobiae bacterium]
MKKLTVGNSHDPIKQTSSLLPWRVMHLPYPPETVGYSHLQLRWVSCKKIKLPWITIHKREIDKPGPSVNYDLLCSQLESILNQEEASGYELQSLYPTHSGSYSVTTTQKRPHHQFLKTQTPSHYLHSKEALLLIFKKKVH